jgi:poly(A) polymerase
MAQFLKDEGAVLSPEDENKREKVIRELKKVRGGSAARFFFGSKKASCDLVHFPQIVMHWANAVAYEQSVPQGLATATVLTYGSYTLGVS